MSDAISESGELVVLAATLATLLLFLFYTWRPGDIRFIYTVCWFLFWQSQLLKTVRSPRLNLYGNCLVMICAAFLLLVTARAHGSRGSLIVPYLMLCVLIYALATVVWDPDLARLRLWGASALVWFASLRLYRQIGLDEFCKMVFAGFEYLSIYVILLMVCFAVLFPEAAFAGIRLEGPFGSNTLSRSLLVLLSGLFLSRHADEVNVTLRNPRVLLILTGLLILIVLTMSRSGWVMCVVFLPVLLGTSAGAARLLALVVLAAIGVLFLLTWAGVVETERLSERAIGSRDSGRLEIARAMVVKSKDCPWFGHGFAKAAQEAFAPSRDPLRDRGFSSHCGYLSVLYDFGVVGSALSAFLYFVVSLILLRRCRTSIRYRYVFGVWVLFSAGALFEDVFWWPVTPLGVIAMLCVVLCSGPSHWDHLTFFVRQGRLGSRADEAIKYS